MKKITGVFVFALAAGFCFALDPAEGYWFSVDDRSGARTAGWEIYESGGLLLGKMLSAPGLPESQRAVRCRRSYPGYPLEGNVNEMPMIGTPWIFGLRMTRRGYWEDGHVINPENGSIYKCKLIYHPADGGRFKEEALEIRGEIGLGIGGSQYWQRCTREQAASLR
ncbi:MAG: DUF2147 domain-containing protein [Spirochaetales bacterium]|jgi:uncharacterized protein (DUF2147 family)|nr:DUF2147 domain-containing protein [Spirochaetales bacterium]